MSLGVPGLVRPARLSAETFVARRLGQGGVFVVPLERAEYDDRIARAGWSAYPHILSESLL